MRSYGADGPVGEAGNGNRTNTNTNTITITNTQLQLQVVKAGNGNGTSQLTAPLKFITADKYNNHISVVKLSEFSNKNSSQYDCPNNCSSPGTSLPHLRSSPMPEGQLALLSPFSLSSA